MRGFIVLSVFCAFHAGIAFASETVPFPQQGGNGDSNAPERTGGDSGADAADATAEEETAEAFTPKHETAREFRRAAIMLMWLVQEDDRVNLQVLERTNELYAYFKYITEGPFTEDDENDKNDKKDKKGGIPESKSFEKKVSQLKKLRPNSAFLLMRKDANVMMNNGDARKAAYKKLGKPTMREALEAYPRLYRELLAELQKIRDAEPGGIKFDSSRYAIERAPEGLFRKDEEGEVDPWNQPKPKVEYNPGAPDATTSTNAESGICPASFAVDKPLLVIGGVAALAVLIPLVRFFMS